MIDYRVHKKARVGQKCQLGPFAVVEAGATLGAGVRVGPHAVIGAGVGVGDGAVVEAHAIVLADVPAGATVAAGTVWRGRPPASPARPRAKKTP